MEKNKKHAHETRVYVWCSISSVQPLVSR